MSEVIRYYYDEIMFREITGLLGTENLDDLNLWSKDFGIAFFTVMKKHSNRIILLERLGYSGMLLQAFNEMSVRIAGDMSARSIDRYTIYYAAGASFNGMLGWLRNGCEESINDIVDNIYDFLNPEKT